VAPPGNQAANRENKHQPIVSEETGLLDSIQLGFCLTGVPYGQGGVMAAMDSLAAH
jgi:hypothetical protein